MVDSNGQIKEGWGCERRGDGPFAHLESIVFIDPKILADGGKRSKRVHRLKVAVAGHVKRAAD